MSEPDIFLSYRRADLEGYARGVYEHLSQRFPGRVFFDWETIAPGGDFVTAIESRFLDWAPAGVRAQAVGRDGSMLDDFLIEETDRVVNVKNAPSPAATASLNVGNLIVDRLVPRFSS